MPFRVAALTCVLLAFSPGRVIAQPGESMVRSWEVPDPSCGDAAHLDAEVARLLGGDPEGRRHAVRVSGAITTGDDGRLSLNLAIEDDAGQALGSRTLAAGECGPLAEAAALLVALAIDPGAVAEAGSEGEAPELPPAVEPERATALDAPLATAEGSGARASEVGSRNSESASASESESESESASASASASASESESESASASASASESASESVPPTFAFESTLFLDIGTLPAPAAGVAVGGRLRWRGLRVALGAGALLPRQSTITRETAPDVSARFYGWVGRFMLGAGSSIKEVFYFDAGAIVDAAVVVGSSDGVTDPGRGVAGAVMIGGQGRFLFRVGRVAFGLEADLRAPLNRPMFEIAGLGRVHQLGTVMGRVGLLVRFPALP